MVIVNESKSEFTKTSKLKKPAFKQFVENRYGSAIAEKWQNIIDFKSPVDFDAYC